jgi:hypothetical protein
MGGDGDTNRKSSEICALRHGELFGIPESSHDFFSSDWWSQVREAVLAEEHTIRNLRMDPFVDSGKVPRRLALVVMPWDEPPRFSSPELSPFLPVPLVCRANSTPTPGIWFHGRRNLNVSNLK